MEARHGVLGRVWIADRGMVSAENLAWLRQTGRRYVRCVAQPDAAQAALLDRLGLVLPKRMRPPESNSPDSRPDRLNPASIKK